MSAELTPLADRSLEAYLDRFGRPGIQLLDDLADYLEVKSGIPVAGRLGEKQQDEIEAGEPSLAARILLMPLGNG